MKIILVNSLYQPQERGGAEKFVRRLAAEAAEAGHQVAIVTSAPKAGRWEVDGLPVFGLASDFAAINDWPLAKRYVWQLANLWGRGRAQELKKILRDQRPDLVVTNNMLGLGLRCLAEASTYRHVHILHDTQLIYPSGLVHFGQEGRVDAWVFKLYRSIVRAESSQVKKAVSPSLWLLEWHRQRGLFASCAACVLPNPRPQPVESRVPASAGPFRLLFVGQLERHKGLELLVEAFRSLDPQRYSLTIAGSGSMGSWLRQQAESGGIDFVGFQSSRQISRLMAESDCLVVPSLVWENAPLVLSEAIASGLPAIGSDFGGIAELITEPELRFAPGVSSDLAEKIKRLQSRQTAYAVPKAIWSAKDYLKALLAFAAADR